jgi:DNA-binding transcriptional MocR family regulator
VANKFGGLSLGKKKNHDVTAPSHLTVPHASSVANPLQKIDLTTALQYGLAQGYPPLYSFLRQFARENLHPNIPYAGGAEIILTVGSTDGFAKTVEALSNVWSEERDWIREREGILVEEFAYMNAVQTARPRGLNIVPVRIDLEGMLPGGDGGLEDVLENWDEGKGKRPHLMYTVT